ncbi:hypothetical protein PLESTB_000790000 [Pleodorina starrii]|uniref:Protein kinase domain-containing protein n=1 Tax=Pleodorina starrii TaxID=330485 RepID=A0A9W6BKJ8_9CHLO|nr:hypothetical protein PLESTM_000494900 [Pleodorina starrii]GLC53814.1 hypothetical protein PLESTB_000790000 [Pleodorina starrii]GLC72994.1 hypothetical protein PLESTF_001317600 [Pleodorina starrii]
MARSKNKSTEAMSGRKTLFDNQLFTTEEQATAVRKDVGFKARLLRTCCMRGASASTKSPVGASKPQVLGGWEDCPAFDLDPVSSRQGSALACTSGTADVGDIPDPYRLHSRQGPVGEAEQVAQHDADGRPGSRARAVPTVNAISSPQTSVAEALAPPLTLASPTSGGACSRLPITDSGVVCTPMLAAPPPILTSTPPQGSAADMDSSSSEHDSLPAADSPMSPQPSQPSDRQHLQHRVALRLLERRGVLPDGRTSASGAGSSGGGASPASDGGGAVASGSSFLVMSPSSGRSSTEYYSALSSPVALPPGAAAAIVLPVETAVEVDERLCLQEGVEDDPLDLRGPGYRVSAPGLGLRGAAWGCGGAAAAAAGRGGAATAAATGDNDLPLRMRGSDFGGVMSNGMPVAVFERARAAAADGGGGATRSAVVAVSPCDGDADGGADGVPYPGMPRPAWSAAGGRSELTMEEKEWLFGQPGGIAGLAPVMALGEGGEGLVDLVRLDLPGRTLHLARKATRTCLPAYALSASGAGTAAAAAAVLGMRAQKVSYKFPYEFFDREVLAMKAVKDCGFVIRFQAAAYDHEAGQGFILMEAAPYGTLEDLHAALCRSQLQHIQRQKPALVQRVMGKLNFKSSAPPSLVATATAATAASPTARSTIPSPHSPSALPPRAPTSGGIGSCGGASLDPQGRERFSCCATASTAAVGAVPERSSPSSAAGAAAAAGPGPGSSSMQIALLGSRLMSTKALKYYGACMLQALSALHLAGLVYRDLKLANILICDRGQVRLADFGAATPCLPGQPGLFGGAAGTRAYLAPEVVPWLGAGGGGKAKRGSGSGGSGSGPEPYTVTVDSWGWGILMVELSTGWSLKEIQQRIINRVCNPRGAEPADLPPDCGIPPALRQLLLEHVFVRDPRVRWSAAQIRSHLFFEGVDWDSLHEAEGPHAHLFARGRVVNSPPPAVDDAPEAVAEAMAEAEIAAAARQRGSRPNALAVANTRGSCDGAEEAEYDNAVVTPFGSRPSGTGYSRLSYSGAGGPPSPLTPAMMSPGGVRVSPITPGGGGRSSGSGYSSSFLAAGGVRQSSPGTGAGGLLIGPVVVPTPPPPGTPSGSPASGPSPRAAAAAAAALGAGVSRRHTLQGVSSTSRLSSGSSFRNSAATAPGTETAQ